MNQLTYQVKTYPKRHPDKLADVLVTINGVIELCLGTLYLNEHGEYAIGIPRIGKYKTWRLNEIEYKKLLSLAVEDYRAQVNPGASQALSKIPTIQSEKYSSGYQLTGILIASVSR